MKSRGYAFRLEIVALITSCLLLGAPQHARAQSTAGALDHLECYRMRDSAQPVHYVADLQNQFGLAPGCSIILPARLFCTATNKRIVPPLLPPGGGPSGTAAGDFLCYAVQCPNNPNVPDFRVEDQFGRRPIELEEARLVCAPANKLMEPTPCTACGQTCTDAAGNSGTCGGSDAAANIPCTTCVAAAPAACTECGTICADAAGNVGTCRASAPTNAACTDCVPVSPTACPATAAACGQPCTDAAGNAGICRASDPTANSPCTICAVPPPEACPCNASCNLADGSVGQCSLLAGTTFCQCAPPPCPCDHACTNAAGQTGLCRHPENTDGPCQCVVPPPPPSCPCFANCTTSTNQGGICLPDFAGGNCSCVPRRPPPPPCPCDASCPTANGRGRCRHLPGLAPDVCACVPQ